MYGRGKLSEIQGLILGMLETFNYEQVMCVCVCVCVCVCARAHYVAI